MYLLLKGEVGVYIESKLVSTITENKVFGERALDTEERRVATIKAMKDCFCLILLKKDYLDILYHVKRL